MGHNDGVLLLAKSANFRLQVNARGYGGVYIGSFHIFLGIEK